MAGTTDARLEPVSIRLASRARLPFIAYASLFLLGLLTAAANETLRDYISQWNQHDLVRATSPDGRVDAVFAHSAHGLFGKRPCRLLHE